MATRPATRCKAADYIQVVPMPLIRASQCGDLAAITAIRPAEFDEFLTPE